jgi:beta-glucanase (GH16 family)
MPVKCRLSETRQHSGLDSRNVQRFGSGWRRPEMLCGYFALAAIMIMAAALVSASGTQREAAGDAIDLRGFQPSFDEQFVHFSISPRGPGTRWIAHTPWNGDFGDAEFTDPGPDSPFTVRNGVLRIEARRGENGKWRSGLLCSRDKDGPEGHGFAQTYGYFEMRARFPDAPGVWPAFWLVGVDKSEYGTEIDVVEQYGQFPANYNIGVQVRDPEGNHTYAVGHVVDVPAGIMSKQFNDFGVMIAHDWTSFYFNRREVWRTPTRPEMRQPMYILADLGLGGGWPIDKVKNPSIMEIAHIKAYGERLP